MPRTISTDEFIRLAKLNGVRRVATSVSCRLGARDRVQTFDYALMFPVEFPSSPATKSASALQDVIGVEPACWFDDGYRLPVDGWEALEAYRRFSSSAEPKGTAMKQVEGFFGLLKRVEAAGLDVTFVGSGVEPILQWAQITLRASQDPAFRKEADKALG
jgi:hypothetical protein